MGQEPRAPSFAGPLFSLSPEPTPSSEEPPRNSHPTPPIIPQSISVPHIPTLPPHPAEIPPPKPSGPAPKDRVTPIVTSPSNPPSTKPTNITAHRHALLHKAHTVAERFLGKFCFGSQKVATHVLPPPAPPTVSHRDIDYHRGKTTRFLVT